MKCIKYVGSVKSWQDQPVIRVSEDDAVEMVRTGNWEYRPKSDWKAARLEQVQS